MAAAAAVELLPDAISRHSPVALAIGFAVGTAAMLAIAKLMERLEGDEDEDEAEDHARLVASEAMARVVQRQSGPGGMLGAWAWMC